jgi:hypothetical protein
MPIDLSKLSDVELEILSSGDQSGWAKLAAEKHGVPDYLVGPVIGQESGGKQSAVSPKGARGIMQLMPSTAKSLGVNPKDWAENIWGGMQYLGEQIKNHGTTEEALAAYNAGPGAVEKFGGVPPYKETKGYIRNISHNIDVTQMSDQELERLAGGDASSPSITSCVGDSCGDSLSIYLNEGPLKGTGLSLPRGGIGPEELADVGKNLGSPVYNRDSLSTDNLTPGTVVHMTRKPGDKNYNGGSGKTHIGMVDQDDQGNRVFRSFTPGKGWRVQPVDQDFINQLPSQIVATNVTGNNMERRMGGVAGPAPEIDVTKLSDAELEKLAKGESPDVDVTKLSVAELERLSGTKPELVKMPVDSVMVQDDRSIFSKAIDYVKGVASPGNQDMEKAKYQYLKQNPDATPDQIREAYKEIEIQDQIHQMRVSDVVSKNIRGLASGMISTVQGISKAANTAIARFGGEAEAIGRSAGIRPTAGPGRYGTEGEGMDIPYASKVLHPEDEKRFKNEQYWTWPGHVVGSLIPYVAMGTIVRPLMAATMTPVAAGVADTFLGRAVAMTATFLPVDAAMAFNDGTMDDVRKTLWHSPITGTLFAAGSSLPGGKAVRAMGAGLAGAGSTAAAGQYDTSSLFSSFATMVLLESIMHGRMSPEQAKSKFDAYIKDNNLTPPDIEALQKQMVGIQALTEVVDSTPAQKKAGIRYTLDQKVKDLQDKVDSGDATDADKRNLLVLQTARQMDQVIDYVEGKSYPSTAVPGEVTTGKGKSKKTVAQPVDAFPPEEKLTPTPMEPVLKAAERERQAQIDEAMRLYLPEKSKDAMFGGGPDTSEWFSRARDFIAAKLPNVGSGKGFASTIDGWMRKGVLPGKEEIKWTGVMPWLQERQGKVTKQEVVDFLKEHGVQLRVVEKGTKTYGKDMWEVRDSANNGQVLAIYENEADARRAVGNAGINAYVAKASADKVQEGGAKFESYIKLPPGATNYREFYGVWPTTKPVDVKVGLASFRERESRALYNKSYSELTARERQSVDFQNQLDMEGGGIGSPDIVTPDKADFIVPSGHQTGDLAADVNRIFHAFTFDQVIDGKRYLTIAELQAEWNRKLDAELSDFRDKKYPKLAEVEKKLAAKDLEDKAKVALNKERNVLLDKSKQDFIGQKETGDLEGKPLFPMWGKAMELGMKKILRKASEEGYDGVAWVSGEAVKERYSLSEVYDNVSSEKTPEGYKVTATRLDTRDKVDVGVFKDAKAMKDAGIAEDMAEKLIAVGKIKQTQPHTVLYESGNVAFRGKDEQDARKYAEHIGGTYEYQEYKPDELGVKLKGVDLKLGGEWANKQYDSINPTTGEKVYGMPTFMDKYGKQWGARVGSGKLGSGVYEWSVYSKDGSLYDGASSERSAKIIADEIGGTYERDKITPDEATGGQVHTLDITPRMKDSVLKGQYMYSGGPDTTLAQEAWKKMRKEGKLGQRAISDWPQYAYLKDPTLSAAYDKARDFKLDDVKSAQQLVDQMFGKGKYKIRPGDPVKESRQKYKRGVPKGTPAFADAKSGTITVDPNQPIDAEMLIHEATHLDMGHGGHKGEFYDRVSDNIKKWVDQNKGAESPTGRGKESPSLKTDIDGYLSTVKVKTSYDTVKTPVYLNPSKKGWSAIFKDDPESSARVSITDKGIVAWASDVVHEYISGPLSKIGILTGDGVSLDLVVESNPGGKIKVTEISGTIEEPPLEEGLRKASEIFEGVPESLREWADGIIDRGTKEWDHIMGLADELSTPKKKPPLDMEGVKGNMSLVDKLHDSPVRERTLADSTLAQSKIYFNDMRKAAERIDPTLLDAIDKAENDHIAGVKGVEAQTEAIVSKLHDAATKKTIESMDQYVSDKEKSGSKIDDRAEDKTNTDNYNMVKEFLDGYPTMEEYGTGSYWIDKSGRIADVGEHKEAEERFAEYEGLDTKDVNITKDGFVRIFAPPKEAITDPNYVPHAGIDIVGNVSDSQLRSISKIVKGYPDDAVTFKISGTDGKELASGNGRNNLLKHIDKLDLRAGPGKMYGGGPDTSDWLKNIQDKIKKSKEGEFYPAVKNSPITRESDQNLNVIENGQALENIDTPLTHTFKSLADAITGGTSRKPGKDVVIFPPPPPRSVREIKPANVGRLDRDLSVIEREVMSNNIVAANRFGGHDNPINEYFDGQIKYFDRRMRYSQIPDNMVKKYGLTGDVRESVIEGQKKLSPVFGRWIDIHNKELELYQEIKALEEQHRHFDPKTDTAKDLLTKIKGLKAELKETEKINQPEKENIYKDRDGIVHALERKYANVRIKNAIGGSKRAEALLTPDERNVMVESKKYYDQKTKEMRNQGMKTVEGDYVNFVFDHGMNPDDAGAASYAHNMWYGRRKLTPTLLDFISRTPGSQDWFPFWYQSMKQYIPSVERKLAFNPYLSKWVPEAKKWKTNYPNTFRWFADFLKKNFGAEEQEPLNRAINGLVNLEYARTLALNLSPPILHLFKLLQTPAWHGPTAFSKGLYRYGKALGQKVTGMQGPERQIMELYIRLPQLIRAVEQSPGMERSLSPIFWRRMISQGLYTGRKLGTALTTLIEHFDNGVNLMASIERGASAMGKGKADPGLIHKEALDTMMRLNFRGFNMPKFMVGKLGRPLFMYTGQPVKLLENKVDLVIKSLTGQRDAYGALYINKAVRLAVLLGGAYAAGQMAGVDLGKHVIHPPGMQPSKDTGEYTVNLKPPPLQLASDIADKGVLSAMWQHFTQIPAVDRIIQMQEEQVGKKYENELMQTLGLPKSGWHDDLIERKRVQQLREKRRHPRKERRMKSPTQRMLDDWIDDMRE